MAMSKNVLIISSSPRKGGNSDLLCDNFLKGSRDAGHKAEKIFLGDKNIQYCTGCGVCFSKKKGCIQRDDMAEILDQMVKVNVIVLATPVYFYSICGQMKTFIDRCCTRYTEIRNKDFYFILTAADTDRKMMQPAVDEFRAFLHCLTRPQEKWVLYGTGVLEKGDILKTPLMKEAFFMGRAI
jgi:multimeric flavodoxin WrbA